MKRWLATALLVALVASAWFWLHPAEDRGKPLSAKPQPEEQSEQAAVSNALSTRRTPAAGAAPGAVVPQLQAAEIDAVEDPPEEEIELALLPPDPLDVGPAALDLRLLDAVSAQPIESLVELWRVDAPGNASWTAGEQLQDQAVVPLDGWVFQRLPEGRYRVVIAAQLVDCEPRLVQVIAPITRLDLTLQRPRTFRVFVQVRDERGVPQDWLKCDPDHAIDTPPAAPWRGQRILRAGGMFDSMVSMESANPQPRWRELGVQPAGGFDLGEFVERRRADGCRHEPRLFTQDGAEVRVPIPQRAATDVHMLAVALSPRVVRDSIRLADASASEVDWVTVRSTAVLRQAETPEGGWGRVPVSIRVHRAGASDTEFTWRPEQGDFPLLHLKR